MSPSTRHRAATLALCGVLAAGALAACKGSNGAAGATGAPGDPGAPGPVPNSTVLAPNQDLPGLSATILGVSGGTGPNGNFVPGDQVKVKFFVNRRDNGQRVPVNELDGGYALVSGPTYHFQRVFSLRSDVLARSVLDPTEDPASLIYLYTFNTRFPEAYLAPMNDTPAITEGEWTGKPIVDGTYTLGMHFWKNYTVDGVVFRDPANTTKDFLVGGATALEPHEVVKTENCNQCHIRLACHGGLRYDVKLCVLCHTEGAEDSQDPTITPGRTVDLKVLIHRIHDGAHLPSVVGVGVDANGNLDYTAQPIPYTVYEEYSDHFSDQPGGILRDFSNRIFPAMPSAVVAMPKNQGYSSLAPAAQAKDDQIRTGVISCDACHGDPDGAGPLTPPLQGDEAMKEPNRAACGSCHDDVDWTKPYTKNGQTQPPQPDDSKCLSCHPVTGGPLAADVVHLHPLEDKSVNPGMNFNILSIAEAGTNNGNGRIDPGERIAVTFTVKDDSGADVPLSAISGMYMVITGPTTNRNLVQYVSVPPAAITGAQQPYTINVPAAVLLERLGGSQAGAGGETWTTSVAPHIVGGKTATAVFERTGDLPGTALTAPALASQNFLDVTDAGAAGIARGKYVVVDDGMGGLEEYAKVQNVQGNTRVWLSAAGDTTWGPWLRHAHDVGASVKVVTLTPKQPAPNPDGGPADYALDKTTGTITEQGDAFDGGAVVASYWSDFVMPSVYPATLNDEPGIDETWGKWAGKSIVDGTYTLGLFGYRTIQLARNGETNRYMAGAVAATMDFLVGSATTLTPYPFVTPATGETCNACHRDLMMHGGMRRGLATCLLCHANAGTSDIPQWVAANAPATPLVTPNFRTMLHKIHMGSSLANAATYQVVGYGGAPYPNNFGVNTWEDVIFPPPGGVRECEKCHGEGNVAWQKPSNRDHPTEQGSPVRSWRAVCGSCHDSSAVAAHIELNTYQGSESCEVCHGPNTIMAVDVVHKTRMTW